MSASVKSNNCTNTIDNLTESAYAISATSTTFGTMANAANKGSMIDALVSTLDHKINFCHHLEKISDNHSFVKRKIFGSSNGIRVNTAAVSQHKRNLESLRTEFLAAGGITALSSNRQIKASNEKLTADWKELQLSNVSDVLRSKKGTVRHLHDENLPSYSEATGSNDQNSPTDYKSTKS
jgi:hypothetical protein